VLPGAESLVAMNGVVLLTGPRANRLIDYSDGCTDAKRQAAHDVDGAAQLRLLPCAAERPRGSYKWSGNG
jgi:hypothetical protein